MYKPISKKADQPNPFIKDPNKVRVLYAGNIGFYQDWEPVLFAAKKLIGTNIEFWVIGEGVKKEYLKKEVKKHNLTNFKVLPYQDRELMPIINSFADIHFISISKEMEQEGFPSKVYTIMACSKPMIVITGEKTPLYNFLKLLNCSILISNNRNEEFTKSVFELSVDKNKQFELGRNGLKVIRNSYTKEKIISKFIDIFEKL